MSTQPHVGIVGGGIAGLSLGVWLLYIRGAGGSGVRVTILDASSDNDRPTGSLAIAPNGTAILDKLGVYSALRRQSSVLRKQVLVGKDGDPCCALPMGGEPEYGADMLICTRKLLADLLLAEYERRGGVLERDFKVQAVWQNDDAVTVVTAAGREATFSLLIGADGVHSRVRREVFGVAATDTGFIGFGAMISPSCLQPRPPSAASAAASSCRCRCRRVPWSLILAP
jgi:2-polyprenyl-6-methoxyphenol hydroxylase-like FAD-dependent oxidoreductase